MLLGNVGGAVESETCRFGEFEFDIGTGELRRRDDPEVLTRLPPQPAKLLAMLVRKNGEIVTREEIRRCIWSDVEIEFHPSLHFCIRQVRAALGDSANRPRYVETLPRRGYRLLTPVEGRSDPARPESPPDGSRGRLRQIVAALLILSAGAAVILLTVGDPGVATDEPLRIAVMPFRPPGTAHGDVPPIAEWLLADLSVTSGERASIIGPTTTEAYDDSAESLRRLATEYRLDYIVNGRFLDDEHGTRMLAELIRVSDGAHTWVEAYTRLDDGRRIGEEISGQVTRELGLGRPPR